jgi:hypothetical protein
MASFLKKSQRYVVVDPKLKPTRQVDGELTTGLFLLSRNGSTGPHNHRRLAGSVAGMQRVEEFKPDELVRDVLSTCL